MSPEHSRDTNELVHGINSGSLWPLTASTHTDSAFVDGVRIDLSGVEIANVTPTEPPAFRLRKPSQLEKRAQIAAGTGSGTGQRDCFSTGRHYFVLPDALDGKPAHSSVEGTCTGCGLVRRYPTSHFRAAARKRKGVSQTKLMEIAVGELPPVSKNDTDDAAVTFDSLCHVGNGNMRALRRVVAHQDNSRLGQWEYLNHLVALGHVDVQRNAATLDVERWEVSPSTLLHLSGDSYQLIGRRARPELGVLREAVAEAGGSVEETNDHGVPRAVVTVTDIHRIVESAHKYWLELTVSSNTAMSLAQALPKLSEVEAALPRFTLGDAPNLHRWDNNSACWLPTNMAAHPGAYRFGQWAPRYVVRTAVDLEQGTAARATAELAKHVAARWDGDPLVGFHSSNKLLVPVGAPLPGLYARAATSASGEVAKKAANIPALFYSGVSEVLAATLISKLMS